MSFLTKDQLDKYVKDLAAKSAKTTPLNTQITQSKSSPGPLSPATTSSSISTSERKAGVHYGPRSPPSSNRSSLSSTISPKASVFNNIHNDDGLRSPPSSNRNSLTSAISPKASVFNINNNNDNSGSSLNDNPIPTTQNTISNNSSTISSNTSTNSSDDKEKESKYKSIDDIVNDLSYPMETKLSFKPTSPPKNNNDVPPPKGADDPTKGSYVLSAAFKSSYSAASRTPSIKKPVLQPSPQQQQSEILSNKKQHNSTIQELQNRSDTNWRTRYNEIQKKYPPLDKLDKEITPPSSPPNKNNVTSSTTVEEKSPQQNTDSSISNGRQTIRPTSSSLECAACGKFITGNVISAMGKKWHPDHFACKKCGITLEHVAFFEKDGNPYCHLDFHELFSPRCGHCETPIEGQVLNALGKSWHPGHFFCRECGNPFEGGFMVHDGFPYCEKDWTRLFAPKCKGCKEPIKGEFTSALDGKWHRSCFVCTTCKGPFDGSYYYIFEGNPYCDKDYRQLLK